MLSDPLLVVATLAHIFGDLRIRYLVGGSLASSVYGIPRATQDVDLVADVRLPHVEPLTTALRGEFYVDADMIREAIKNRASFNVIHLATMFKADVFIMRGAPRTRCCTSWSGTSSATRSPIGSGAISSACSRSKATPWIATTSRNGQANSTWRTCFSARNNNGRMGIVWKRSDAKMGLRNRDAIGLVEPAFMDLGGRGRGRSIKGHVCMRRGAP